MKRFPTTALAILALVVTATALARAEPTGLMAVWDAQATEMRAKKDVGGMVIDVLALRDRKTCVNTLISVRPVGGGETLAFYRAGATWLTSKSKHGSFIRLAPGRYEITRLECTAYRSNSPPFEGPHARFEVRGGEFVDLGVLILESDSAYRAVRRRVVAMSPQARAELKERMTKNFGFMRVRHMTAIAPKPAAPTQGQ
jgi:hypothetical protein